MIKRYIDAFKKTFTIQGRSTRSEFNTFYFGSIVIAFILGFMDGMLGTITTSGDPIMGTIFNIAILIPSFTICIRRLHDMDYKGWWILCPFVIIALVFWSGTVTENRFGENPRTSTVE